MVEEGLASGRGVPTVTNDGGADPWMEARWAGGPEVKFNRGGELQIKLEAGRFFLVFLGFLAVLAALYRLAGIYLAKI